MLINGQELQRWFQDAMLVDTLTRPAKPGGSPALVIHQWRKQFQLFQILVQPEGGNISTLVIMDIYHQHTLFSVRELYDSGAFA